MSLWFSLLVRSSFLKTTVTPASFISDGSLPNSIDLLNSCCKTGEKISILSLIIFVGMSEFGEDLEESSFLNSFSGSVCYVTEAGGIFYVFIMTFN